MPEVTVYWRPMCGYCSTLKSALDERGIAYESVDIWSDRAQAAVVAEANGGDELVPTVRVGQRYLPNPPIDDVLAAIAG